MTSALEHIPFHLFGGTGEIIHFAHANGYPPGSFHPFMQPLIEHYQVLGVHHRPLWPSSQPDHFNDWAVIADDLIRFLEAQGLTHGIIGMGHSLGAVATMMVALKRPLLFTRIILIDPVFLPPEILELSRRFSGGAARNPLVQSTLTRRNRWGSPQDAFDRFRAKKLFARWTDEALWHYIHHAIVPTGEGDFTLAYSREWEAKIYSTPPTDVWDKLPKLNHPTLAIRGAESTTLTKASWELWQHKQPNATFLELDNAGHMVPMERPLDLAQQILGYLNS